MKFLLEKQGVSSKMVSLNSTCSSADVQAKGVVMGGHSHRLSLPINIRDQMLVFVVTLRDFDRDASSVGLRSERLLTKAPANISGHQLLQFQCRQLLLEVLQHHVSVETDRVFHSSYFENLDVVPIAASKDTARVYMELCVNCSCSLIMCFDPGINSIQPLFRAFASLWLPWFIPFVELSPVEFCRNSFPALQPWLRQWSLFRSIRDTKQLKPRASVHCVLGTMELFLGQVGLQLLLLILVIVAVPWMIELEPDFNLANSRSVLAEPGSLILPPQKPPRFIAKNTGQWTYITGLDKFTENSYFLRPSMGMSLVIRFSSLRGTREEQLQHGPQIVDDIYVIAFTILISDRVESISLASRGIFKFGNLQATFSCQGSLANSGFAFEELSVQNSIEAILNSDFWWFRLESYGFVNKKSLHTARPDVLVESLLLFYDYSLTVYWFLVLTILPEHVKAILASLKIGLVMCTGAIQQYLSQFGSFQQTPAQANRQLPG